MLKGYRYLNMKNLRHSVSAFSLLMIKTIGIGGILMSVMFAVFAVMLFQSNDNYGVAIFTSAFMLWAGVFLSRKAWQRQKKTA